METDNMSIASDFSIIPEGMVDEIEFEHVSYQASGSVSGIQMNKEEMNVIKFGNVEGVEEGGKPIIRLKYCIPNNFQPKSSDRICLYKVGFSSFQDYVAFKWAPVLHSITPRTEGEKLYEVITLAFEGVIMPSDEFEFYQFCYVTSEGQMVGVSNPFQLSQIRPSERETIQSLQIKLQDALIESQLYEEKIRTQEESLKETEGENEKLDELLKTLKDESEKNLNEMKQLREKMELELDKREKQVTEMVTELLSKEEELKKSEEKNVKVQRNLCEAGAEIQSLKSGVEEWTEQRVVHEQRLNVVLNDNLKLREDLATNKQQLEELKRDLSERGEEKEGAEKVATDLSERLQKAESEYRVLDCIRTELEAKIEDLRAMLAQQDTATNQSPPASNNGDWVCVDNGSGIPTEEIEDAVETEESGDDVVVEEMNETSHVNEMDEQYTHSQQDTSARSNIPDELKIESKDLARAENVVDKRASPDIVAQKSSMIRSMENSSIYFCNSECSATTQQLTDHVSRQMEEIVHRFATQIDSLKSEIEQLKKSDKSENSTLSISSSNAPTESLPMEMEVDSSETQKAEAAKPSEEVMEGISSGDGTENEKSKSENPKPSNLNSLIYGMSFLPAAPTAPVFLPTDRKAEGSTCNDGSKASGASAEKSETGNISRPSFKGGMPVLNKMCHAVAASVATSFLGRSTPSSTPSAPPEPVILPSQGGPAIPMPPPPSFFPGLTYIPMPPPPFFPCQPSSIPTPPASFEIPQPPIILRHPGIPSSIPIPMPPPPAKSSTSTTSSTDLPPPLSPERTPAARFAEEQKKNDPTTSNPFVRIDVDVCTDARLRSHRAASSSRSFGTRSSQTNTEQPKRESSAPPTLTPSQPEQDSSGPMHCPMCSLTFPPPAIRILEEHINSHLEFVCPMCSEAFQRNNQDMFETHVHSHFQEDSSGPWDVDID